MTDKEYSKEIYRVIDTLFKNTWTDMWGKRVTRWDIKYLKKRYQNQELKTWHLLWWIMRE